MWPVRRRQSAMAAATIGEAKGVPLHVPRWPSQYWLTIPVAGALESQVPSQLLNGAFVLFGLSPPTQRTFEIRDGNHAPLTPPLPMGETTSRLLLSHQSATSLKTGT